MLSKCFKCYCSKCLNWKGNRKKSNFLIWFCVSFFVCFFQCKVMCFRCTCNFISFIERYAIREGCLAYHILGLYWTKDTKSFPEQKNHKFFCNSRKPFHFVWNSRQFLNPILRAVKQLCSTRAAEGQKSIFFLGFPPLGELVHIFYSSVIRGFLLSLMIWTC